MSRLSAHSPNQRTLIRSVFAVLESHYGYFDWWPDTPPYQTMLGTILVQNTNWRNADKALNNLGKSANNPHLIELLPLDELAQKIRPSGYFNQKAIKLKALTEWFKVYQYDIKQVREIELSTLRKELLAIKGVGGETADAILVYAIGKPSFVIDAYVRRIFERNGLEAPKNYETFRLLVEQAIPADTKRYAFYHGLMVEHGQQFCNKCALCPLVSSCFPNILFYP
ncbi:endonuclease [Photobacterium sp. ZSDE20]|uniref:Endonuclease n=1 Tax=Photobacterium pectinilyticum TaxID=2906793 RepID=A0ABT1NAY8_9GAMM|nr:endonuclease [Photobacterium sp. ZSDE20]MCQ1061004.1 endonuclease [Photobacterium sp. ZSDE20]MDD1829021.1 endonuclease [Photobacterium sp. ZSDE20]